MDDFNFFTIICIIVAVLVLWQLWRVLGTKSGYQGPARGWGAYKFNKKSPTTLQQESDQAAQDAITNKELDQKVVWEEIDRVAPNNAAMNTAFRNIYEKDKSFSPNVFAKKAQDAYEMILTNFFSGQIEDIKPLLSAQIYDDFLKEIESRNQQGETINFSFIGVKEFNYLDATLQSNIAILSVQIVSEIVFAVYDKDGNLLEGDPKQVIYNKDVWQFERDLEKEEPVWLLTKTEEVS